MSEFILGKFSGSGSREQSDKKNPSLRTGLAAAAVSHTQCVLGGDFLVTNPDLCVPECVH